MDIPEQLSADKFRFILVGNDKRPQELEWTTKNNYPYDSEKIKKQERYGVLCGENNLVVIDYDNEIIQKETEDKLPETFTVKTAGKGLHHLYYVVDNPKSFVIKDINNKTLVDIQGKGRQVIGPNSILNGRKYEIIKNIHIAKVSITKILDIFEPWIDTEKKIHNKEETDDECELIKQKVKVPDLLQDWGIDTSKDHTDCPMHDSRSGTCFEFNDNVWRCYHCKKKGNIFHLLMFKDNLSFPEAKEKLAQIAGIKLFNPVTPKGKSSSDDTIDINEKALENVKDLKTLLAEGIPNIEWQVQGILPKSGISIFGGTAGSMKSWAGMQLALSCATGTDFLNQFSTKKCTALYIDEENGRVTTPFRFDKLVKGHKLEDGPLDNLYVSIFNNVTLDDPKGKLLLKNLIDKYKPEVVILDSMVRCISGDENKASDVKKVFETIKEHLDEGISFIILHHTTKKETNSMEGLRGSGDFSAFADSVLMFSKGTQGFCNVKTVKNRHIAVELLGEFYFLLENDTDTSIKLEWKGNRDEQGDVNERCAEFIINWIRNEGIEGFETQKVIKLTQSQSYSKNATQSALKILLKKEFLAKLKRGKYTVTSQIYSRLGGDSLE